MKTRHTTQVFGNAGTGQFNQNGGKKQQAGGNTGVFVECDE